MKQPSEEKQAQLTSLHLRRDQIHRLETLEGQKQARLLGSVQQFWKDQICGPTLGCYKKGPSSTAISPPTVSPGL